MVLTDGLNGMELRIFLFQQSKIVYLPCSFPLSCLNFVWGEQLVGLVRKLFWRFYGYAGVVCQARWEFGFGQKLTSNIQSTTSS